MIPLDYQGQPNWIGQASSVQGGRFAKESREIQGTEPNVDEVRNNFLQDVLYSQAVAKTGFVKGGGGAAVAAAQATPARSADHTDGLRAVMAFTDEPVSLSDIELFDWKRLSDAR